MTTAITITTDREHQPSTPASTGPGFLHLIDDAFLSQFVPLAYQPANTSEDEESVDQIVRDIVGGPLQGGGRWIALVDSSTLIHFIRSTGPDKAKWLGRAEPETFFHHGATSVAAEPMFRTKLAIMGAASSPPDEIQFSAESATDGVSPAPDAELPSRLEAMFAVAGEETFFDGMDSDFARNFKSMVRSYGHAAIDSIGRMIRSQRLDVEVAGEALRQIGSVDDVRSHRSRLALLLQALESPDPRLRDAASIGIATMDDPTAIEGVRRAEEQESSPQLRHNLQLVLDQLEETRRWRIS